MGVGMGVGVGMGRGIGVGAGAVVGVGAGAAGVGVGAGTGVGLACTVDGCVDVACPVGEGGEAVEVAGGKGVSRASVAEHPKARAATTATAKSRSFISRSPLVVRPTSATHKRGHDRKLGLRRQVRDVVASLEYAGRNVTSTHVPFGVCRAAEE